MAIEAGRRVFGGRYEARRSIGSGGMAEVFLAYDQLLDRDVAVKALDDQLARDPHFIERFRREARTAARLSHPNIVALHDYGSTDDSYFIVMEYIEGRTVGEIIADDGPLNPARVAEIASDVAAALERAHGAGLVHRDVTSSNVMISTNGETKVTDFGIARVMDEHDQQTTAGGNTVLGTAAYISPEQAQGQDVDERTDIYSLGIVMFEMLTGRPPFMADNPLALASQHVLNDPPRPSSLNDAVPEELDAIVLRALAKRTDARFGSAAEMREELGRFVAGKKVRSTLVLEEPFSPVFQARAVRARRSFNPMPVAMALLFGLLALVGVWLVVDNLTTEDGPTVPELEGRFLGDAQSRLSDLNVDVQVQRSFSDEPSDIVLSQRPEPGVDVNPGDTVFLEVSKGPEPSLTDRINERIDNALDNTREDIGDMWDGVDDFLFP
ncbi:MAG: protein kinase [Actinomycetota bacterium]|nr:protein kinase [Actinomycetota bacterium]